MSTRVPNAIRLDHIEARACLRAKCYRATLLMARRILEGITLDHRKTKGTLAKRLQEMRDEGVIDGRLYEWADALRLVGNSGAHDITDDGTVSRQDAQDAVELVEALLDYLYEFQAKFALFQARRDFSPVPAPPISAREGEIVDMEDPPTA